MYNLCSTVIVVCIGSWSKTVQKAASSNAGSSNTEDILSS